MCRRKPARTSSRINTIPLSSQSLRTPGRNPSTGNSESWPASCLNGEMITPAILPLIFLDDAARGSRDRCSESTRCSRDLRASRRRAPACTTRACRDTRPQHIAIFGRPVACRATSVAQVQTSEPFLANTVQSANGVIDTRCSASSTHTGPGALKQLPRSIWRRAASSTLGWRWPRTIGPYEHM